MNCATPKYTSSSCSLSLLLIVSLNQEYETLTIRRRALHILKIVRVTYSRLCESHTQDCASHILKIVRVTYSRLCESHKTVCSLM
jgi:hypothetical protein